MRHTLALLLVAASWTTAAIARPPADLDEYVGRAMQAFGPPGLGLAIVEDGKTVVAKGYGVRRLGTSEKVDEHTAFPIGSETKAFTATALAILVDRKKLSWDDRVIDRLPGFQMYDPYATAHMTIRDLLTHRSGLGLGEGDLLIIPGTTRSRADIVRALRYLKPRTGFRETFAYDNILYIVAGALVEAVSGQSWESFVNENIFKPAGMADALGDFAADNPHGVALHARTSGLLRGAGDAAVIPEPPGFHTIAPAGGVNASPQDMARWMMVQLNRGTLPSGGTLFSRTQADALWNPAVVVPADEFKLPAELSGMQPGLQTYALGWFVESYHGHIIVEHSGAVFGALAVQYLIPDENVGFSVTINSEDGSTLRAVAFHLLDHYLELPPTDWLGKLLTVHAARLAKATAVIKALPKPEDTATTLSAQQIFRYAGTYQDSWYGRMTVSMQGNSKFEINFNETPSMTGSLDPISENHFRTHWTDRNIEDAYVDFKVSDGQVTGASMRAISPLADFSFDYQDLHFSAAKDASVH